MKITATPALRFNLAVAVLTLGLLAAPGALAQAPQALLKKYRCDVCHAEREAKTGPAYVDVAAKYRGDRKAFAALTAEVKRGAHGAGPWHMPPHPEVSEKDAKAMVRYILSLRE